MAAAREQRGRELPGPTPAPMSRAAGELEASGGSGGRRGSSPNTRGSPPTGKSPPTSGDGREAEAVRHQPPPVLPSSASRALKRDLLGDARLGAVQANMEEHLARMRGLRSDALAAATASNSDEEIETER